MNQTLIRRYLLRVVVAPAFVLPAALLAGCAQESPPPAAAVAASAGSPSQAAPVQTAAKSAVQPAVESVQVGACDGGAPVKVAKTLTGQALAEALLDQWQRSHPEANWVAEEKEKHMLKPPADNAALLHGGQGKGDTYGSFTRRDLLTWNRETEKFVAEGSRIFHNSDELGSTVAVSCDMCHPHAANTHPETYPKFQTQLGRVVLLRDMINWCVQNPVRGEKLDSDGPKMRALEAYIQAQRKGVAMDYGRH